jgi:hypothetical protein
MKRRIAALVALAALTSALLVTPLATAARPQATGLTTPITGTATNALGQTVNFAGTFTIDKFVTQNGSTAAQGTLTGTLTNTVTGVVQNVTQAVTLPLAAAGTCQILHLTLGPLDLNLLGLVVHLDRVVLDITAQSGPGNLLGNLLCGIAGLLDGSAPANVLTNLLNTLLGVLQL